VKALLGIFLFLFSLALAGWAVTARDAVSSVIGFIGFGVLLTIIWVRLAAPDVALTEAAVGAGASGVLFLTMAARTRGNMAPAAHASSGLRIACAAISGLIAAGCAVAMLTLPVPAASLSPAVLANLPRTELANPVAAVLLAYRALDTLLEAVVLVLALAAIWSLAPDDAWGKRPMPWRRSPPQGSLSLFARVLPPVGIIIGIHLAWVGAVSPGGAFQGGTVLAAMWLLAMMAGLAEPPPVSQLRLRLLLVAGPILFIAVGFAGMFFAEAFLAYPVSFTKPLILGIEAALTLSIAVALGMLLVGPPAPKPLQGQSKGQGA
jgi:multisubunit Na+/H+ antiporter MnhB subunit